MDGKKVTATAAAAARYSLGFQRRQKVFFIVVVTILAWLGVAPGRPPRSRPVIDALNLSQQILLQPERRAGDIS